MQKRNKLIGDIRQILTLARKEERGLTGDEKLKIEQMEADIAAFEEISTIEKRNAGYAKMSDDVVESVLHTHVTRDRSEYAVRNEMRSTLQGILRGDITELRAVGAMSEGSATLGGKTVNAELLQRIIEKKRDLNPFWNYAEVIPCGTSSLLLPVETTQTTGAVVAEAGLYGSSLSAPTISQIALTIYKVGHQLLVSEELLADNEVGLENYLIKKIAQGMAAKEETIMVAGTGSGQPTGFAVATSVSSVAITTVTLSITNVSAAKLFDIQHTINPQYRKNGLWVMHDGTLKGIRKLTDAVTGQFLWQPGLLNGAPDMLLGRPVVTSAFMPQVGTTTRRSVIFMDPSLFVVGQRQALEFRRLTELYAANGQVGLLIGERFGCALTLAEAIAVGVSTT